jgi:hypothetical protein
VAKPPDWNNEEAVADWVIDSLFGSKHGSQTASYSTKQNDADRVTWPAKSEDQFSEAEARKYFSSVIESAVAQAEHGRDKDLFALLHPNHPWNKGSTTVRAALNDKEWRLIYDRGTGKHKPKNGPPPKSMALRQFNPVHCAAIAFPYIKQVLGQTYPKQSKSDIRDRAYYAAARYKDVPEQALINYLTKRSKSDRRRPSLP